MSLTQDNIRDLRATWPLVSRDADGMAAAFYAELFRIAPELRPMFPADLAPQGRKLATALDLVVRHAGNLAPVLAPLRVMGARHDGYGVEAAHYALVGQALIATLRARLGAAFTAAAEEAWATAYAAVAATMQAGAAEAARRTA
ncbi:globin domain-containing protein [Poseidonocella sp. HB161398]|uniref:globin domain-containing protein n=1 Tax=Poseidonocella sp. HB161398 TaxID=2320855 RepID=UPI001109DA25|nr:globin domain-containing protein [Poseidonocella sp. HB161398]